MNFINKSIFKLLLFAKQHNLNYEICYHPDESSDEILDINFLSQHDNSDVTGKTYIRIFF
ncbi:hypothetical protein BGV21_20605 [Clostridioides difficile]|uniref:hypothetical protein n=1 Tax=Clostridioides difficile TaxID=1496 RepID=UPI000BB1EDEF|nr:hypothetical protein [Clostridioides difficile]PBH19212.1 hypothetical protein BGV21_20605 [Clostridioides difficile]